ncbi:MAG: translation initiation factor IF-2 subunit alpha [Candidatus Bathyarchaeota archaeon]|jgi:translation initiation factor 2 subunit 1|nr:translation initiation factor IF-2 subunit alpha [Candidatus Bathyarchaeota archaeon]
MAERKSEWPERGDLVIATIESITTYGAYAKLDEYDKTGLLHISEIASSWIRNIRDFVREGQKIVLKVVRVKPEKGQIDVSLRRVTRRERIEKIKIFKKDRKAETLIRNVAEKAGLSKEEVYEKAGNLLEEEYGLYDGFEKVLKEGTEVLTELGVPEDLAKIFAEVAEERISVKMVKIKGIIEIRCMKPNGVKIIQDSFENAYETEKTKDTKIRFYVKAAPKYNIEVLAENYKRGEEVFQKISERVVANIIEAGGQGAYRREK